MVNCNSPKMQDAVDAADAVIALINSQPRSPTKMELYEAILGVLGRPTPAVAKPDWLRTLFCDERGENDLVQFDGPRMAYYELNSGWIGQQSPQRLTYDTVKWQSTSVERLQSRVAAWAKEVRLCNSFIVWRVRPEIEFSPALGKHLFYARLHLGHGLRVPGAIQQGTETPEA